MTTVPARSVEMRVVYSPSGSEETDSAVLQNPQVVPGAFLSFCSRFCRFLCYPRTNEEYAVRATCIKFHAGILGIYTFLAIIGSIGAMHEAEYTNGTSSTLVLSSHESQSVAVGRTMRIAALTVAITLIPIALIIEATLVCTIKNVLSGRNG